MFIKVIFWIAVFVGGILWVRHKMIERARYAEAYEHHKSAAAEHEKIRNDELNSQISYCRKIGELALTKVQSTDSIGYKKFWSDIHSSAYTAINACETAIKSYDFANYHNAQLRYDELNGMFRKKIDIKKSDIKVLILDEEFYQGYIEIERQLRKFGITNITTSNNPKKDLRVMNSRFVHEFDFILLRSSTNTLYFDDVKIEPANERFINYALVADSMSGELIVKCSHISMPIVHIGNVTDALNRKFNFVD